MNITISIKKYSPVIAATALLIIAVIIINILSAGNNTANTPNGAAEFVNTTSDKKAYKPKYGEYLKHSGEMMAVWVPYMSISNESSADKNDFISNFEEIIKTSKEHNMNTLVVHIRPFADSMYPSDYFPYSHILSGKQGEYPGFNPLEYMVNAAHKAGLEFHAWINPLRIKVNNTPEKLSADNPYNIWKNDNDKSNDDYVLKNGDDLYLNPAYSEVRKYIIGSIKEIVTNYAVDGIHFDDYFYPTSDVDFDKASYEKYKKTAEKDSVPLTQNAWRTANINSLISGVYSMIHSITDNVEFGISPQGNIENDIGMNADVYSWGSIDGYVDYICPQIYVNFEHSLLPFDDTAKDWRELVTNKNVKLYLGLAVYKAGSDADEGSWEDKTDILKQEIEYGREIKADGFMLYSYDYLENEQTKEEIENVMKVI